MFANAGSVLGKMTQTFEEYVDTNALGKIYCKWCRVLLGYAVTMHQFMMCSNCMKKDYEENKK